MVATPMHYRLHVQLSHSFFFSIFVLDISMECLTDRLIQVFCVNFIIYRYIVGARISPVSKTTILATFIEEIINKNDVMLTGFNRIADLLLTWVSFLVCEHG